MKRLMVLLLALCAAIVLGAGAPRHYRLVQPWSKMKSLSDDQREQIYYIHRKSLDKIKEIKAQEQKDILELLSDDQKLELVQIDEANTVARKLRAAAARVHASPATAQSSSADDSRDKDSD
jgi:hypothetical protein